MASEGSSGYIPRKCYKCVVSLGGVGDFDDRLTFPVADDEKVYKIADSRQKASEMKPEDRYLVQMLPPRDRQQTLGLPFSSIISNPLFQYGERVNGICVLVEGFKMIEDIFKMFMLYLPVHLLDSSTAESFVEGMESIIGRIMKRTKFADEWYKESTFGQFAESILFLRNFIDSVHEGPVRSKASFLLNAAEGAFSAIWMEGLVEMNTVNKRLKNVLTQENFLWFNEAENMQVICEEIAQISALRHVRNDFSHPFGDEVGNMGTSRRSKLSSEAVRNLALKAFEALLDRGACLNFYNIARLCYTFLDSQNVSFGQEKSGEGNSWMLDHITSLVSSDARQMEEAEDEVDREIQQLTGFVKKERFL